MGGHGGRPENTGDDDAGEIGCDDGDGGDDAVGRDGCLGAEEVGGMGQLKLERLQRGDARQLAFDLQGGFDHLRVRPVLPDGLSQGGA